MGSDFINFEDFKLSHECAKQFYVSPFIEMEANYKFFNRMQKDKINIITDIRYAEYPEDEYFWLKNKANGILIHVSRYDQVGEERKYIQPANPSEERNDHKVKKLSDFSLNWKTEKNYRDMIFNSRKLLKWLKKIYVE